ncbi:MAG TPA: YebC/PmpR family DNA-binding transcriptional regulator [Elusimicrobiales bacterium]|nr:YebC/PmpR family DNA-binding transcriptional regulator [Elusimicrobiales bacterium]
MGGHSHWAGIKHKKAIVDAKKGKVYTKIIREITIAAKLSGGDPDKNPRLRKAMEDAKSVNMPQDNVKRAILKGTGQLPGVSFEEVVYEGYGPAKIAIIVEATTDNKNRTVSEIRKIFDKTGGSIGSTGCVSYMFKTQGYITVKKDTIEEDKLTDITIEAGAQDIKNPSDADYFEIITEPTDLDAVKKNLVDKGVKIETAEITKIPDTTVKISDIKKAQQIVKMMDELDNHEDVKNIYSNFDIPDDIINEIESQQ